MLVEGTLFLGNLGFKTKKVSVEAARMDICCKFKFGAELWGGGGGELGVAGGGYTNHDDNDNDNNNGMVTQISRFASRLVGGRRGYKSHFPFSFPKKVTWC